MKLADISILEADLIVNKRGSNSKVFAEMMNNTRYYLGEKMPQDYLNSRNTEYNMELNNQVFKVCDLIIRGFGIEKAIYEVAKCPKKFRAKLSDEQLILIKNTKSNWTTNIKNKLN